MSLTLDTTKRIDFVFLFDVAEGNPNGDPAAQNSPRVDPYDGHGIVTDVCLKRKVRDFAVDEGHKVFITREPRSLNSLIAEAAAQATPGAVSKKEGGKRGKRGDEDAALRGAELCRRFVDVRLFGAMAETGPLPAGRIRGPVQVCVARSLAPVEVSRHQVTRVAVTDDADLEKPSTMSRETNGRQVIAYAAYRAVGTFSPRAAAKTGCGPEDLDLLFRALTRCWARDRSSARGVMGARGLYVAQHDTEDGRCHASDVHNAVRAVQAPCARSWADVAVALTVGQRGVTWYTYGWDGLEPADASATPASP